MRKLGLGLALLLSCQKELPAPTRIVVHVSTNRGTPVSGAEIAVSGPLMSTALSDATGTAAVAIGGREGEVTEIAVKCPAPLRSPTDPLKIQRLDIAGGPVERSVKCDESRRTLVVVVRAENGPNVPIVYQGQVLGRTDASGAAHVKVDADTHDRVELTLRTTEPEMAKKHPQNPQAVFEPAEVDEIKEWSVTFTTDAKKAPAGTAKRVIKAL